MKKIITAMGEQFINKILSKENDIEIIGKDFLYLDAVFEIIENNKIDFLIINENIFENLEIINKLNEIKTINKKIKIIIIINNKKNIINKLKKEKNIYIILYNKNISRKNYESELMKNIKSIIQNQSQKIYFELDEKKKENLKFTFKFFNKQKNRTEKNRFLNLKLRTKDTSIDEQIITIIGEQNIGKSTVAFIYANKLQKVNNSKILIIDFDIFNQSLFSKFQKKKFSNRVYQKMVRINYDRNALNFSSRKNRLSNQKIKNFYIKNYKKIFDDFLIKINNKLFLISGIDFIFKNNKKKINNNNLINEIKNINDKYKIIIIDTGSKNEKELNDNLLKISTKIFLVVEPEISKIKNAKKIIDELKLIDERYQEKIEVVLNQYKKSKISFPVVKKVFKGCKIRKIHFVKC